MQHFWYPEPQPQQPRRLLPVAAHAGPPNRGPLAAAVLTAILAWPQAGEPVPHESLLRRPPAAQLPAQVFPDPPNRGPLEAQDIQAILSWPQVGEPRPDDVLLRRAPFQHQPTAGDTDLPPVRRTQFTLYVTEGVFYQQWYAIPSGLPNGVTEGSSDPPPPRAVYQSAVQDQAWQITWEAQQRPQSEPPTEETVQAHIPRGQPQTLNALEAWQHISIVEVPLASAPQLAHGDEPPRRLRQPQWVLDSWQVSWAAQSAPSFDYASVSEQPHPFRRLQQSVLDAWTISWDAQRSATSAEWIPPPFVAGDEISLGRPLPQSVLDAWVPPFIMPERAPWFDQGRVGDDPPPFRPFPHHLLQWQVSWHAQHAALYHDGLRETISQFPRFVSDELVRFGFLSDEDKHFGFVSDETIPL